jgi:hypothetical protein
MTYAQLKQERQAKYDQLFDKIGLFWAFGDDQFDEGKQKHPLTEGQKYCSIGAGGYFPGQNKQAYTDGMDTITAWAKIARAELKANKEEAEQAILYELKNHECFYSSEIDEVIDIFKGIYTREQIRAVYRKYSSSLS